MRHRKLSKKFGRTKAHREMLVSSLVCSLIEHSRIRTTVPKAKQARRLAEKMVTIGRKQSVAARRLAASRLRRPAAVSRLFEVVVPSMDGRNGGYTRIVRLGARRSDGSEMCMLEWVAQGVAPAKVESSPAENAGS